MTSPSITRGLFAHFHSGMGGSYTGEEGEEREGRSQPFILSATQGWGRQCVLCDVDIVDSVTLAFISINIITSSIDGRIHVTPFSSWGGAPSLCGWC